MASSSWSPTCRRCFEQIEQFSGYRAIVLTSAQLASSRRINRSTQDATLELRGLVQKPKVPVVTAFTGDAEGAAGCWECGVMPVSIKHRVATAQIVLGQI